jgi:hypothetical protein
MADKFDTNTVIDQYRLAKLLAGLDKPKGANPFSVPFAGPSNEPGLPPFEQPGAVATQYMPDHGLTPTTPPVTVTAQAPPMPQPMPAPAMPEPVAEVPPMPTPQHVGAVPQDAGFDPNDPRYLPEQWRGSFSLRS